MPRLTNRVRGTIIQSALRARFLPDLKLIETTRSQLFVDLYNHTFDSSVQTMMASLPPGWLPEVTTIVVDIPHDGQVAVASRERHPVVTQIGGDQPVVETPGLPVYAPHDRVHRGRMRVSLSFNTALCRRSTDYKTLIDETRSQSYRMNKQLVLVLGQFRTVRALLDEWPAMSVHLPTENPDVSNIADLSRELGLEP